MPILRQRKDDGGHYVRANLPGTSAFATWQISPEGIETLRRCGYVGVDIKFPQSVLKDLIDRGQAYTHGSGVDHVLPALRVARAESAAVQAPRSKAAVLVILPQAGSWGLAIQVNEIPRMWSSTVESLVDALSRWELAAEASKVPATQLWPGRGGAQLPVNPRREPYYVRPVGRWPANWDVVNWLGSVPGFGSEVTLFSGEGRQQLDLGLQLELGESYFLVAPADTTSGRGRWPPPSVLDPESLGVRDGWQAWSIQVPRAPSIRLSAWCDAIGYRLAQPRYRLILITPPHRYSEQGLPVVFADREIVFSLSPMGGFVEADDETSFYTVRFQEPGMYRVALDDVSTSPLYLVTERKVATLLEEPAAIAIDLNLCGEKATFHAFKDGTGPHTVQIPQELHHIPPSIVVRCAVPLDLRWELGATKGRIEQASAEEACARASERIVEAIRRRENLSIQLDAGAYGRLQLAFAFQQSKATDTLLLPLLPPAAALRARWLAIILRDGQHRDTLVPLTSTVRRKLSYLSNLPGCASLRELRTAPASLIPRLHAITRLVQD